MATATLSALERLRRQMASTAKLGTASRATTGFGGVSKPATRRSPAGTASPTITGFGAAPRSTITTERSKLSPSTPAAQTFANYTPEQKQQLSNQMAAATGGAMGTPAATTPPASPAASGFGANPTMTAKTAFGKQFTPDSAEMMRSNPDALIAAYYKFLGMPANGGEQAMSQEMNSERLRLLNVLFGEQGMEAGSFYPYADFAGGFLGKQRTPGAATYGAGDVVNAMLNAKSGSPIYEQLYGSGLTPDQQADRFISGYSTANAGQMDPYVMNARQSYLVNVQNEYIALKAQGKIPELTFGQYLQQKGFA
jgi:hypothetical protein